MSLRGPRVLTCSGFHFILTSQPRLQRCVMQLDFRKPKLALTLLNTMQFSQMSCTLGLVLGFMFPQLVTNAFYVCVMESDVLFNLMFWLSMQLVLESPI